MRRSEAFKHPRTGFPPSGEKRVNQPQMITVIANLKGGTGKSTLTFNLAVWLGANGARVKVLDLDPQQNLVDVAALRRVEGAKPPLDVEPGPLSYDKMLSGADHTLVDVGTADIESFKRALAIADLVLIPVTPSQADLWSTQRFVHFMNRVRGSSPSKSLTFINRAHVSQTDRATEETSAALRALPGVRLIPQRLSDRPVFRDSFSEGLAVFELEPRSRGSAELKELASTVFRLVASKKASRSPTSARRSTAGKNVSQAVVTGGKGRSDGPAEINSPATMESRTRASNATARNNRKKKKNKSPKRTTDRKQKHFAAEFEETRPGNGKRDKKDDKGKQSKKQKKRKKRKK